MNLSGYNDKNVRVAVICPVTDGWVNGRHEGWTTHSPLRVFPTLEAAKDDIAFRLGPVRITWKEETV